MNTYRHHVTGFFLYRSQVEKIFSQVIAQGIAQKSVSIFDKYSVLPVLVTEEGAVNIAEATLKNMFFRGDASSLAGTGLGSLLGVKLIAKEVTLIVEDALIPQLVALGWATSMRVIDTNFYTRDDIKMLADLVHDAVLSRQIVIAVETSSQEETAKVSELIQAAVGALSDVI